MIGKLLLCVGAVLIVAGGFFLLSPKLPSWLGHLPGDIAIKKRNFSFYFPITTCLLASGILTLIIWLFTKR